MTRRDLCPSSTSTIFAGTSEIQRPVIAQSITGVRIQ